MNKEVTFRRAAVGGFNRNDVMDYINNITIQHVEQQNAKESLSRANEEISKLKSELDAKNVEIESLRQQVAEIEQSYEAMKLMFEQQQEAQAAKEPEPVIAPIVDAKTVEFNGTADKLMRESMAYADRYVESANLVAENIRKETIEKVKEADIRVKSMLERAMVFTQETESFETMLKFFKAQLDEIKKNFEE